MNERWSYLDIGSRIDVEGKLDVLIRFGLPKEIEDATKPNIEQITFTSTHTKPGQVRRRKTTRGE